MINKKRSFMVRAELGSANSTTGFMRYPTIRDRSSESMRALISIIKSISNHIINLIAGIFYYFPKALFIDLPFIITRTSADTKLVENLKIVLGELAWVLQDSRNRWAAGLLLEGAIRASQSSVGSNVEGLAQDLREIIAVVHQRTSDKPGQSLLSMFTDKGPGKVEAASAGGSFFRSFKAFQTSGESRPQ